MIIGDLVTTINILLSGGTTVQFILKAFLLFVSAAILAYYLDDVRRETPTKLGKHFAWI